MYCISFQFTQGFHYNSASNIISSLASHDLLGQRNGSWRRSIIVAMLGSAAPLAAILWHEPDRTSSPWSAGNVLGGKKDVRAPKST